jgi:hypothetical protein
VSISQHYPGWIPPDDTQVSSESQDKNSTNAYFESKLITSTRVGQINLVLIDFSCVCKKKFAPDSFYDLGKFSGSGVCAPCVM